MTTEEALSFIHSVYWRGSKPGLSRTQELLHRLGDPQDALRFVHIAGTNGKGSTAAMFAEILQQAGYRTGLYTSPYLHRFHERMRVDGAPITDGILTALTEEIRPIAESMEDRPTEFEIVTALAMAFFAQSGCDIVVLEVGMGGRLDSTNVIPCPALAVITRIGLDHTAELGDTIEKIALEKAGIIKPGGSVVIYEPESSVRAVFEEVCAQRGAEPVFTERNKLESLSDDLNGQRFRYRGGAELYLPLLGRHQLSNAAVVLDGVETLRKSGWDIPPEAVVSGLRQVSWPGRFEVLSREPWFIVDGGHNPQCAETVRENLLTYFPGKKHVLLVGVLADKDYPALCAELVPAADAFVTVKPDSPRALSAEELAGCLRSFGKPVTACGSVPEGVALARELAGEDGVACAVGSLYMAGPVRECFGLAL